MKRARRWILSSPGDSSQAPNFSTEICALPCIARLLQNRGLHDDAQAEEFLRPRLRRLSDPFLLPQMRAAVDRILHAITGREQIVLYGDYDVDGVTSLALLSEMLRAYGARAVALFAVADGGGLRAQSEGIERCWQTHHPQLLIAIDCGTSSCVGDRRNLRARRGCDRARSS